LNDHCTIWDIETERKLDLPAFSKPVRLAAWSPRGDLLVLARPQGGLELIGFPGGETVYYVDRAGRCSPRDFGLLGGRPWSEQAGRETPRIDAGRGPRLGFPEGRACLPAD